MPTTFVDFLPTASGPPFQFQAALDGVQYTVVVSWNLWRQGWFINVYQQSGGLVLARPMVGSPTPLALGPPLQTQPILSMAWSADNSGQVAIVLAGDLRPPAIVPPPAGSPSVFALGDTVQIQGATNTGTGGDSIVNGQFVINTWTDAQHFSVLLNAGPGVVGDIGGSPVLVLQTFALSWSNNTGQGLVRAHTDLPHGLPLGGITSLVVAGASPAGYNGRFWCAPTTPSDFTFMLPDDPGVETVAGTYSPDISLVAGYFTTELIWREDAGRFEIRDIFVQPLVSEAGRGPPSGPDIFTVPGAIVLEDTVSYLLYEDAGLMLLEHS